MVGRDGPPWNHNIHYHRLVLDALPHPCGRVLDVGCGEGPLTESLLDVADEVVGIDVDGPAIQRARATTDRRITYVQGDALTHGFPPGSFDAVVSVAASHHFDLADGLARMADLVRPGGVVAVVGLGTVSTVGDLWFESVGFFATRILHRTRNPVEVNAPILWPPPLSHRQSRKSAERALPGVRYRRHVLFRHSLVWTKPPARGSGFVATRPGRSPDRPARR